MESARRSVAINNAPIAPTPAASVGVAKPPSIEPSTANIRISGGNRAPSTLPIEAAGSPSIECAGMVAGRNIATTTR